MLSSYKGIVINLLMRRILNKTYVFNARTAIFAPLI